MSLFSWHEHPDPWYGEGMKNVIVCAGLLLMSWGCLSGEEVKPDWRVEIVPSRHTEGKGAVLYAKKPIDVFYVVLHNQSGRDLRVWRDWCPWGYDNLSLTAEVDGGEKIQITRVPNKWSKTYPDAALVKAGKSYVYEVHLGGKTWVGADKITDKPFKLTVTFKVLKTPESTEKNVWVGKAVSQPGTVTLRR